MKLIESAEQTASVKAEIELGIKETVAENKEGASRVKEEMEKWAGERAILGEAKDKLKDTDAAGLAKWKKEVTRFRFKATNEFFADPPRGITSTARPKRSTK